ncbi:MAG: DNA-directed RNA polymerase subunit omega [Actinomycetes bacterium]
MSRTAATPEGITNPPIDELLDKVDNKYSLVIFGAKRARQINAYYSQLAEGLLEYVGPLVETHVQEKALSVALREINEDLLDLQYTPASPGYVEPVAAPSSAAIAIDDDLILGTSNPEIVEADPA